jgi:thiol-disulfide isomerase/thioredoxin
MARYAMSRRMFNVLAVLCAMLAIVGCAIHTQKLPDTLTAPDPNSFRSPVYVIVRLEGQTVPGRPAIAPFENEIEVLHYTTRNFYPQPAGLNKWSCALEKDCRYVVGWISEKMQGYRSQPFVASDGLEVVISPGMPITLECDLTNPPKESNLFPAKVYVEVPTIVDGNETTLAIKWLQIDKPSIARIGRLAAGKYKLIVWNEHKDWKRPYLNSRQYVELSPDKLNKFSPIYPNLDTKVESGDFTIKGTVFDKNKIPAPNKEVFLLPLGDKGLIENLFYPIVVTGKDGSFEFKGANTSYSYQVMTETTTAIIARPEPNSIAVIDIYLDMKEFQIKQGKPLQPLTIQWLDGTISNVSDYTGKVVVIDFWASWCRPCLRALPNLNAIAEEYKQRQDIIFIAASVDSQQKEWLKAVNDLNCNNLRHGWLNEKTNYSTPNTGVPYYIIINKEGTIDANGFEVDVEKEITKLLTPQVPVSK